MSNGVSVSSDGRSEAEKLMDEIIKLHEIKKVYDSVDSYGKLLVKELEVVAKAMGRRIANLTLLLDAEGEEDGK